MDTIFYYLFIIVSDSGIKIRQLAEAGNLFFSFSASIVVFVDSFESVYQDHWLDSKMRFLKE